MVDLTGQVASETIGPRVHTGVGGQTAFSIAANYSRGGRSITVLPGKPTFSRPSLTSGFDPEQTFTGGRGDGADC